MSKSKTRVFTVIFIFIIFIIGLYPTEGSKIDATDKGYNVLYVDSDDNGIVDRIKWIVLQLSEQKFEIEADLAVINVQSYPMVGNNWAVRFNTTGKANLTIAPVNGTYFDMDLRFLELRCGSNKVEPIYNGTTVFYANWDCSEEGRITNKVLRSGKHTLEFNFGSDVEYAFNQAGWWNTSYQYRRQLNVTAGANTPFNNYTGYTVRFLNDTTGSKFQDDCDDLRILYWNGTDNIELDRDVINCNTTNTDIRFQLQANISASSTDSDYYMYYGYPGATNPPANNSNVYLWYDDGSVNRTSQYTKGRVDASGHGGAYVDTIAWNAGGYYDWDTGDNFGDSMRPTGVDERDVYVEVEMYHTGAYPTDMTTGIIIRYICSTGCGTSTEDSANFYYYPFSDSPFQASAGYSGDRDINKDNRNNPIINDGADPAAIPGNQWIRLAVAIWGVNPTNIKGWDQPSDSGWQSGSANVSGTDAAAGDFEGSGEVGLWVQQDQARARNILVRRYTEPEPSITVGSEVSSNTPPTTPTNITCDGSGNCNITVDTSVVLNASGSTDADGDNITYFIEASLQNITTTADLEPGTISKAGEGGGLDTGTGADGSVNISASSNINTDVLGSNRATNADGIVTTVTANPTGTSISVSSTTGFAADDEILLINLQGASGDTADVGNYEFLEISSVPNSTTLNLKTAIQNSYDGNSFANQTVVVQRVPQWTDVAINSGGTLTANDWDGSSGGVIVFRATGTVTVNSGGAINATALGYRGGAGGSNDGGLNGESYDGVGLAGTSSGGNDTVEGSGGGNPGTRGGGGSSNSGLTTAGNTAGTRGGGGGGGNVDGNIANDGAGGGGGGGYGFGGGGGGGGGDSTSGGAGGSAGNTSVNAGGGGGGGDGPSLGGAGGAAGSAGADDGAGGGDGGAVGSGNLTGLGGSGGTTTYSGVGGGGGGGGGSYGVSTLTTIFLGSGGGGGGGADSGAGRAQSTGATGGDGGGIIFIAADTITLTGTITSDGTAGAQGGVDAGGSGGASGGSIMLQANTATIGTNLVTGTGGSGGALNDNSGAGGSGGDGRIRIEADSSTGTTNPTASTAGTPSGVTLDVAMVCGTAACTDANRDVPMRDHLNNTLGHNVSTFVDTDQTWTPTDYDVVVISESVLSSNTAWLKSQAVGIFTVEGANNDEFELGSGGSSSGGADTDINITDNSHYITSIFSTGVLTVTTATTNLGYMSGWANDVTKLAHYNSDSTLAKLLYVESGGILQGGVNTAAERRVFFGAQYFNNLNDDGKKIFDRALDWAAYNTVRSTSETNTTYTTYNDVNSAYGSINNVTVIVEVDSYNPEASVEQSTNDPDLELEIYNGTDFVTIGVFNLNLTYTGDSLNTSNANFTLTTTDSTILSAWETVANQDLRIRGRFMDFFNDTTIDEINYTNVWVTINGKKWTEIGNHTQTTTFTWNTTALPEQTGVDLRARAIDLDGSNTYSSYFTKGSYLNISHVGVPEIIDITLSNVPINFSPLNPGASNQNAIVGNGYPMIVTIESTTNVDTNLSLKGTDFTFGAFSFGSGNLSYSNTTTDAKTNMTNGYPAAPPYANWINIPAPNGGPAVNRSVYFWISIPPGQEAGTYNSTVTVKVESQ